jgi:DNA-binding CsgD family transcriptional regulator
VANNRSALRPATPLRLGGQLSARALQLLNRAASDALRGHEASCRVVTAEAGLLGRKVGVISLEIAAEHVLGLLELSTRNLPIAVWHLSRCEQMARTGRGIDPLIVRYEPDLVEVLLALGQQSDATVVATAFAARAERLDVPWAAVAMARCRGLLAGDASFEAAFRNAQSVASAAGAPFERARTELCFGERLRRTRRRVEARGHLACALETFRAVGAGPWADRAARELQATSGTARRRGDQSNIDDLTPQEHCVARLMAEGATVREAAARMLLSPKTVEAHLGRAYRKLGVHNRAQLTGALARATRAPETTPNGLKTIPI